MKTVFGAAAAGAALFALVTPASAADVCRGFGPQTPRDIANKAGSNKQIFNIAASPAQLNLCNIHFHGNAEHKAPGFSVYAGPGDHGGYKCNETASLSPRELAPPAGDVCKGLKPGATIEVHWVFTSCQTEPGKGLGSCLSKTCANPQLRVEAQTFLVVNDDNAADFTKFAYTGALAGGRHQPKALPTGTGTPVVFRGSTTGPSYSDSKCSPLQVTWSVRPQCAKVSISSLAKWCKANVFQEDYAHGVRKLVKDPALLSKIQ